MKVTSLKIPEVKLIELDLFKDERGSFFESFNQKKI
jgi:dTDP-4-dehydrorhamnose 3,5-epimerase-like enzyme